MFYFLKAVLLLSISLLVKIIVVVVGTLGREWERDKQHTKQRNTLVYFHFIYIILLFYGSGYFLRTYLLTYFSFFLCVNYTGKANDFSKDFFIFILLVFSSLLFKHFSYFFLLFLYSGFIFFTDVLFRNEKKYKNKWELKM